MHMLFLLTTVLTSHPLALEASVPAHLEGRASLILPNSQEAKSYLLDPGFNEQSGDGGSATRILGQYAAGWGIGVVGAVAGILAIADSPTLKAAAFPAALWVVGNGVGVSLTGWAVDGRGRFGFVLLGSVIGFVAPLLVGTGILLASGCDIRSFRNCGALAYVALGVLSLTLVLTPVGAIMAYELSAPTPWLSEDYASRSPRPAPRFVPVLTLARQGVGGTLGIAWRM